ncbi:hypothetical protein K1T71_008650 [Dendrolimus kikuchii]|uniref:Uncharacterized protein n=1 Tax=Dendrolimus kikuchii TaxID=765133 RepID=A0ACC1CV92_9NEOP|nr:hypothetical protein K1T71_008650 [Dendrolimus kikuchii]
MVQQQYSLSWDFYKSNICSGFSSLQQNGEFVDMTLAADGHFVKVHQALVALSSPYLKSIITSAPCQHPVIFLNKISYKILSQLLEYIYTGEVLVSSDDIGDFVEAAESLSIKGLENLASNDAVIVKNDSNPIPESLGQMPIPVRAKKIIVKNEGTPIQARKSSFKLNTSILNEDDNSHDFAEPMDNTGDYDTDDDGKHLTVRKKNTQDTLDVSQLSSNLQYSISIRGALQIVLNRFIYNLSCKRSKGIRRWRCVNYRCHKCKAFVVTQDNVVLNRANPHNHPFHDKKILAKIEKNTIFSAIEDVKLKTGLEESNDENDKSAFDDSLKYSDGDDKNDITMFGV